jgi:hypothetical protein
MLSRRFADESTALASDVKLGAMTISRKISLKLLRRFLIDADG